MISKISFAYSEINLDPNGQGVQANWAICLFKVFWKEMSLTGNFIDD
jgi:hypothetical protein